RCRERDHERQCGQRKQGAQGHGGASIAYSPLVMPRILAVLAAAVALVWGAHTAAAKPKRKVRIETDPPGATVYVGDKKAGPKGTTPVTIDLAPGEQTLIIELDGYLPHTESITVSMAKGKAAKSPQKVAFALDKAVGTIRMSGLPQGAKVTVDGNE